MVGEDWQLSQFWYSADTSKVLATEAIKVANGGTIGCISTPSVYRALKELNPNCKYYLFEYDKRFSFYGEYFVFYDYKEPFKVPSELKNCFDFLVLDPPFLSEECFTKTAITATLLKRSKDTPVMVCSGMVMEGLISRLFPRMKLTNFKPQHERRLQNDFGCFVNYNTEL